MLSYLAQVVVMLSLFYII